MVDMVRDALARRGIQDEIVAAAMFFPRGHSGAGLIGGDLGDRMSGLADGLGALVSQSADDGGPRLLVGVSARSVYGFATRERERDREATELVFRLPRSELEVRVHQRLNVRVVELFDRTTGARVELEGARMPGFHVGDVLHALRG
jgi:hypothetical protein